MSRRFALVALYGILNAAAYCCLLPLWEGFDEAYHYDYVQILSTTRALPASTGVSLSREIWHAFELTPVSHWIQPSTGAPIDFARYFALPSGERIELARQLRSLPASEKYERQPDKPNYEATQSPLPYLLLAPLDSLLASWALPDRILALRLILSIITVLLIAHSTFILSRKLGVPETFGAAALFCVFSSQMLYATTCHVCNDWLAVPLMTYLLCAAIDVHRRGSRRDCLLLGLVLSAALLTKAYCLILVPFACGVLLVALWRRRLTLGGTVAFMLPLALLAAPWYARNLILYHNLTGRYETAGLGVRSFIQAAGALPWRESIVYMAHASLWTGNNSHATFSAVTLDALLALLAAGVLFNFLLARARAAEWIVVAGIVVFSLGMAQVSVAFYISSHGAVAAASPWYSQLLLVPVLLVAFSGFSRARQLGRVTGAALLCLWTYVLIATYLLKLAPMYGGYMDSRSRIFPLLAWYASGRGDWSASLADPWAVWILIGLSVTLSMVLAIRFVLARV